MRMKERWTALRRQTEAFMEKRGFFLLVCVCLAVIAASAMLSGHTTLTHTVPTPPVGDAGAAARLMQQSLAEAVLPTPQPARTPAPRQAPLAQTVVLRPFDDAALVLSPATRIWAVHDAVDLAAAYGDIVRPICAGSVLDCAETGVEGAWVLVDHGEGLQALYACLAQTAGLKIGDPVYPGQAVGFAGLSRLDETDMEPHLHLRVTRDGTAIDPLSLWDD